MNGLMPSVWPVKQGSFVKSLNIYPNFEISSIDPAMAKRRYGLTNGDMVRSELSSEMAFSALSISITTSTERDRVDALIVPSVK